MSDAPPPDQPPSQPPGGPPYQGGGRPPFSGGGGPEGPDHPRPGGDPTSGGSLAGVLIGLGLALAPAVLFGMLFAILSNTGLPGTVQLLVPLILGIAVPVGIFVVLSQRLKDGDPQQVAMRTAMRIIVFIAMGTYAVLLLGIGACIALLVQAY